jgi:hypothetical protein
MNEKVKDCICEKRYEERLGPLKNIEKVAMSVSSYKEQKITEYYKDHSCYYFHENSSEMERFPHTISWVHCPFYRNLSIYNNFSTYHSILAQIIFIFERKNTVFEKKSKSIYLIFFRFD